MIPAGGAFIEVPTEDVLKKMQAIAKVEYSPQSIKKREILTKLSNNLNYVNYTK